MIRRLALVTAGYVLVASVVLGASRAVARIVLLPPLFLTLLAGLLVLGLPLVLAVAWTYRPPVSGRETEGGPEGPSG